MRPAGNSSVLALLALIGAASAAAAQGGSASRFSHEPHRGVACVSCHVSSGGELGPARLSEGQCQSCHHKSASASACTSCHATTELSQAKRMRAQFRLSVSAEPVSRMLAFAHAEHASVQCSTCHTTPPRYAAAAGTCTSCHESHHAAEANCRACHETRAVPAHGTEVHRGCTGSGCHQESPVPSNALSRQLCLSCHATRADHNPQAKCVECHVLPSRMARRTTP